MRGNKDECVAVREFCAAGVEERIFGGDELDFLLGLGRGGGGT